MLSGIGLGRTAIDREDGLVFAQGDVKVPGIGLVSELALVVII